MSLTELVEFFEHQTDVPIAISDVQSFVLDRTNVGRLQYIDVDLDPQVCRGFFRLYRARPSPYSDLEICCDILLSRSLGVAERRLVACKELIHLLDPSYMRISNQQQVEHLISSVTSRRRPHVASEGTPPDVTVRWDFLNEHVPGAILFPMAVRSAWLDRYKMGDLTCTEIAEKLQAPESLVLIVLNEKWPEVHAQIKDLFVVG
jgi:hypothetical protein